MNSSSFWVQLYENKQEEMECLLQDLNQITFESNGLLEEKTFFYNYSPYRQPQFFAKQVNLYWAGIMAEKRICEIGFSNGYSAMLMLLGRNQTPIDFTVFDYGYHSYTKPCLEYLQYHFHQIKFEYVEGDSTILIPIWLEEHPEYREQYDVVHINGGNSEHFIKNDMANAVSLLKIGGMMIINNTHNPIAKDSIETYLQQGKFEEITKIHTTYAYPHRIIKKIL
jgi:predicted O-methyltransferase YrrM